MNFSESLEIQKFRFRYQQYGNVPQTTASPPAYDMDYSYSTNVFSLLLN